MLKSLFILSISGLGFLCTQTHAATTAIYDGLADENKFLYFSFDGTDYKNPATQTYLSSYNNTHSFDQISGTGINNSDAASFTGNGGPYGRFNYNSTIGNAGKLTLSFFYQANENSSGTIFSLGALNAGSLAISTSGYILAINGSSYDMTNFFKTDPTYWANITITNDWTEGLKVYINGEEQSFTGTTAPNGQTYGFQIGAHYGNGGAGNLNNVNLDEVCLWGGTKLTKEQINSYATKGIPEPTTATLSFLALAGLMARRRRIA